MLYATIFEQQSFGTAMEFAVTALSTGTALALVVWDARTPFLKRDCAQRHRRPASSVAYA